MRGRRGRNKRRVKVKKRLGLKYEKDRNKKKGRERESADGSQTAKTNRSCSMPVPAYKSMGTRVERRQKKDRDRKWRMNAGKTADIIYFVFLMKKKNRMLKLINFVRQWLHLCESGSVT